MTPMVNVQPSAVTSNNREPPSFESGVIPSNCPRLLWEFPDNASSYVLPDAGAAPARGEAGDRARGVLGTCGLDLAGQVAVDDRGAAVRLLEIGVGEADPRQVATADQADPGAGEGGRQVGLQVDRVAVGCHGDTAALDHKRVRLAGVGAGPGREDVAARVDRLRDVEELLVVARALGLDPLEVLLERRREAVV